MDEVRGESVPPTDEGTELKPGHKNRPLYGKSSRPITGGKKRHDPPRCSALHLYI